jgi:hypothetical protein
MTWNPLRAWRERQEAKKQEAARAGKASSGNLDPSERAAMFARHRGKLPK